MQPLFHNAELAHKIIRETGPCLQLIRVDAQYFRCHFFIVYCRFEDFRDRTRSKALARSQVLLLQFGVKGRSSPKFVKQRCGS
eukprot:611185-Rhodomonas_salina.1